MLTLKNVAPSQAAHYYTQAAEVGNSSSIVSSVWAGIGTNELGLTGRVGKKNFKSMLWGYLPDGSKFRQKYPTNPEYTMRGAIDLCFSLPKTYSLLIGIKEDRQVKAAFKKAIIDTLKLVEKEAIATRKRTARGREIIYTENLVAAIFFHNASRDNDPQYHGHGLILNMTKVNSKWYSIHNDEIFKRKKLINLYFQNALAYRCSKLGYILEKRENDSLEIAGFEPEHLEHFSNRRKKILQLVPADAPWKVRQVANLKTRQKKQILPERKLQQIWRERAKKIGLIIPRKAMNLSPNIMSAIAAIDQAIDHYSEKQIAISRQEIEKYILEENLGKYSQSEIDLALGEKIGDLIVLDDGRFITKEAIRTEQQTIEMMQKGLDRTVPIVSMAEVEEYCNQLKVANIELTEGQKEAIVRSATSTSQILGWQGIAGSGKSFALHHFNQIAAKIGIAVTGLAPTDSATDNLANSVGIKCTNVATFLKQNSKEITLPNGQSAIEVVKDERVNTFEEIGVDGKSRFEVDRVLIIDEAGLIGAKDMRLTLEIASQLNYKVLLVGDRNQHKPVAAGEPFASLQNQGMPTVILNQSIRQTNPILSEVVKKLGNKRYGRALGQLNLNSAVIVEDNPAEALAAEYVALTPEQRRSTLFICSTHRQRNEATEFIRNSLKSFGILKNPKNIDILVEKRGLSDVQKSRIRNLLLNDTIVSYKDLTFNRDGRRSELIRKVPYRIVGRTGEKLELQNTNDNSRIVLFKNELDFQKSVYTTFSIEVAVGDKLRWRKSDRHLNITKGEEFYIEKIDSDRIEVRNLADNRTQTISSNDLQNSEYGWTLTSHSAQGQTAERVFLLPGPLSDGISFYTDVARAKADIKIAVGTEKHNDYNKLLANITRVIPENNPSALMKVGSQDLARFSLSVANARQSQEIKSREMSAVNSAPVGIDRETVDHRENLAPSPAFSSPQPSITTEIDLTPSIENNPRVDREIPEIDRAATPTLFSMAEGESHIESLNRQIELTRADEFLSDKKKQLKIEGLKENIQNWEAISQLRKGDRVQNQQGQLGIVEDTTLNHDFVALYVAWLDEFGNKRFSSPEAPRLLTIAQTEMEWELKQNGIENAVLKPSASRPITRAEKNEQTHKHWDELKAIPLVEVAPLLGGVQDKSNRQKWRFGSSATVSINGDKFKDWKSAEKGNRNAINFVMHINKCDFNSAVRWLEENMSIRATRVGPTIAQPTSKGTEEKEKVLSMPKVVDANWNLAKNYLAFKRQLPPDLIERLHKEGRIYADDRQNVVFVRRALKDNDFTGEITGGFRKGTNVLKPFAKTVYGTKTDRGWFGFTTGSGKLSKIVITEAAIDAISAATILDDRDKTMFISTGGASLPIPIDWLIQQNKKGVEINLAFDNDRTGEELSWRRIKELIQVNGHNANIKRIIPSLGKDWNDQLRNIDNEPLNSLNKWEKFALALGKSDNYINRVKEVISEFEKNGTISDRARESYFLDLQAYQVITNQLRQAYKSNLLDSTNIESIIDAAIAFHSVKAKPLEPETIELLDETVIDSKVIKNTAPPMVIDNLNLNITETPESLPKDNESTLLKQQSLNVSNSTNIKDFAVPIDYLITQKNQHILTGNDHYNKKSTSLTALIKDLYGWQNWCSQNEIPYLGEAQSLIFVAGKNLGLDELEIQKIIESNEPLELKNPSVHYWQGDSGCWLKLKSISQTLFNELCPAAIQKELANNTKQSTNRITNNEQRSSPQYPQRINDSDRSQNNSPDASATEPRELRANGVDGNAAFDSSNQSGRSHREDGHPTTAGLESNLDRIGSNRGQLGGSSDKRKFLERDTRESGQQYQGGQQNRSDSRREPKRNLEQSSAEHQGSNQNRRRSRQFVEQNLDKFRSNLGRDRDRSKRIKRYRIVKDPNSWDSVRTDLIKEYNFPESLVNGLKNLDLLGSDREENAVFRLVNEFAHTVGSSRIRGRQQQLDAVSSGYFAFGNGSGELKRVVLTSDPIEAMAAATISQPETRSLFIGLGDKTNIEAVANYLSTLEGVDVIAAFSNDRIGEELTWTLAKNVEFIHRYRINTTWSEYVKETGSPNLEPLNWQIIDRAVDSKKENDKLSPEAIKELRLNNFREYKNTQVQLCQWYEAAYKLDRLEIKPMDKDYLSNIIEIAKSFNSNSPTPLSPSNIEAMKADINLYTEHLKNYQTQFNKPYDVKLEELKNYDLLKDPQVIQFDNQLDQLAKDGAVHIAKIFAQSREYEFYLSFNQYVNQELISNQHQLSEGLVKGIEQFINHFTDKCVENTIAIEDLYAKYLNTRSKQFTPNAILTSWGQARKKEVSTAQYFQEWINVKRALHLAEKIQSEKQYSGTIETEVKGYVEAVKDIAIEEVIKEIDNDNRSQPIDTLRQKCLNLFNNVKNTFDRLMLVEPTQEIKQQPQQLDRETPTTEVTQDNNQPPPTAELQPELSPSAGESSNSSKSRDPEDDLRQIPLNKSESVRTQNSQNTRSLSQNATQGDNDRYHEDRINDRQLQSLIGTIHTALKNQKFQGSYIFQIEVNKEKVFEAAPAQKPIIDRLKPEHLRILQLAFTQPDRVKEEIIIRVNGNKVFELAQGQVITDLLGLAPKQRLADVKIVTDAAPESDRNSQTNSATQQNNLPTSETTSNDNNDKSKAVLPTSPLPDLSKESDSSSSKIKFNSTEINMLNILANFKDKYNNRIPITQLQSLIFELDAKQENSAIEKLEKNNLIKLSGDSLPSLSVRTQESANSKLPQGVFITLDDKAIELLKNYGRTPEQQEATWSNYYSQASGSKNQKTLTSIMNALADGHSKDSVKNMILFYDPSFTQSNQALQAQKQRANMLVNSGNAKLQVHLHNEDRPSIEPELEPEPEQ
ncbi:MAG: MobF family relaxase [Prochloraceae cyanobacterium]